METYVNIILHKNIHVKKINVKKKIDHHLYVKKLMSKRRCLQFIPRENPDIKGIALIKQPAQTILIRLGSVRC